jgi:tetratricopeptide (TPR) repeat protein
LAPVHVNLGIILLDQQRIDEAIARFQASIEFDPKLTMAYQSLAQAYAATGQWNQVAAELDRALERDANDHEAWRSAAYAHLAAGDAAGYRRICRETLKRFGCTESPVSAPRAAMTLSVLPDAVSDLGPVERLARHAVTGTENHGYYRYFALAKALTEGRAGRPAEAINWMERFAPRTDGELWDATGFAALAMAQHHLSRREEAKASLAKAQAIVAHKMPDPAKGQLYGSNWLAAVHAQVATREAEELLNNRSSVLDPK